MTEKNIAVAKHLQPYQPDELQSIYYVFGMPYPAAVLPFNQDWDKIVRAFSLLVREKQRVAQVMLPTMWDKLRMIQALIDTDKNKALNVLHDMASWLNKHYEQTDGRTGKVTAGELHAADNPA